MKKCKLYNYILNNVNQQKKTEMKIRKTAKADSNSNFRNKLSRNRSDPNKYSNSDELVSFI